MAKKRTPPKGRPTPRRDARRRWTTTQSRRKRRQAIGMTLAGVIVIVGVVALAVRATNSGGGSGTTSATAFDLPRLNGKGRIKLASFTGRPTVVNFFASWCTACNDELPGFTKIAASLHGRVNFVFVNSNETGDWQPMAQRTGILDMTLAKDVNGAGGNGLYQSLGGTGGMPITAFYDSHGKVITVSYGALLGDALPRQLQQLYGVQAAA